MSTQNRYSGSGGGGGTGGGGSTRTQKKSVNVNNTGGVATETITHAAAAAGKKSDTAKTEKEKIQPKPTPEQLRIALITSSNASEDPQMREKVTTLIEMTQRSEEEVCCALNECDNNLERAADFLLETLPIGAFEISSKKKKSKATTVAQNGSSGGGGGGGGEGDGIWHDGNANVDKREKSRNRSSIRGGRGGTDSRGWRGRETRENERNLRESRTNASDHDERGVNDSRGSGSGTGGGGPRSGNYSRGGPGGRGIGYASRSGRGGGRMNSRPIGPGRSDRGGGGNYANRQNISHDDHQEVELWDNTIAQNAEKQQQAQDDAWGDWDNEEYVGSLKDSKVFTTSNLPNQTTASVVSGTEISAPPGLTPQINSTPTSIQQTTSTENNATPTGTTAMQYSAALQQHTTTNNNTQSAVNLGGTSVAVNLNASQQYNNTADTFTNAANAAASLVQQVQAQQQQQKQLKASSTLSVEQSQYFNSLTSQNTSSTNNNNNNIASPQQQQQGQQQQQPQIAGIQFPATYANVFGAGNASAPGTEHHQSQLNSGQQVQQVRRPRSKLPPPSKIPSTAVEMPGDSLSITYLDVQFGGLDFGNEDTFDALSDKFNTSVTIDNQPQPVQTQQQQQQQQQQQIVPDVSNEYQNKQPQTALTTGLQNPPIGDTLTSGYNTQRAPTATPQQQIAVTNQVGSPLDQLTKNEHVYNPATNGSAYQNTFQTNATNKAVTNAYQQSAAGQSYNNNAYGNVQASNAYQGQGYGSYQQNAVNSYQQQQVNNAVQVPTNSGNSAQNIPVGGVNSNNAKYDIEN